VTRRTCNSDVRRALLSAFNFAMQSVRLGVLRSRAAWTFGCATVSGAFGLIAEGVVLATHTVAFATRFADSADFYPERIPSAAASFSTI